jgi:hypothetical protein
MKNIILCFDGTCNEAKDAEQEKEWFGLGASEDSGITNILKLHLLLGGDLEGKNIFSDQISFYYPGVGTYGSWIDKIRNMALAPPNEDVGRIIKRAVQNLHTVYEDGDRIYVFGFSRGAAIARRFSSVLKDTFPALGHDEPKIRFMGVFDTVAAIKHPNLFKEKVKPASDVVFEDKTISPLIEEALHLVSLNDRRIAFFPTLMNRQPEVTEVWFAGAHSDVGGGYQFDGLSDLTLQFMLDYMDYHDVGLKFRTPLDIDYDDLFDGPKELIEYDDVIIQPNYLGKNHQQEAITKIKESFLDHRAPRVSVNDKPSIYKPLVHFSVFNRMHDDPDYDPEPLRHNMINPYTGEEVGIRIWHSEDHIEEYDTFTDARLASTTKPTRLDIGEDRLINVHSNQKYNASRVLVKEGDQLVFSVDKKQVWYDGDFECNPTGWKADNKVDNRLVRWAIKFKEDDRRFPAANWFEVIASINKSDDNLIRVLDHTKKEKAYTCQVAGEIHMFANDLKSKYGNNRGSVAISVKRVK